MSTWDDKPNDYDHAVRIIERLRDALRKIDEIACNKKRGAIGAAQMVARMALSLTDE